MRALASWRIGLSLGAAREQVRVARRLEDLPAVAEAFGDGRISYSKVCAITRVAESGDGIDGVELGRHCSAGQLEEVVRGPRRAQFNAAAADDPEAAAWSLRTRVRYDDHGSFTLTISGPAQHLPVIQAGIEAKKAGLQQQREADAAAPEPQDDVPAETRERASVLVEEPGLDEQATGGPAGITGREVPRAMDGFFLPPSECTRATRGPVTPRPLLHPQRAGTPQAEKVTDAEALRALAHARTARPTSPCASCSDRWTGALPIPRLHPAQEAARPPRRLLA